MEGLKGRAGRWLTQPVAIILSSKSISILDCSSIHLLSLCSLLPSGFPFYNMACFLGVRKIYTCGEHTDQATSRVGFRSIIWRVSWGYARYTLLWRTYWPGQSVDFCCYCQYILLVHTAVPVPSPIYTRR